MPNLLDYASGKLFLVKWEVVDSKIYVADFGY